MERARSATIGSRIAADANHGSDRRKDLSVYMRDDTTKEGSPYRNEDRKREMVDRNRQRRSDTHDSRSSSQNSRNSTQDSRNSIQDSINSTQDPRNNSPPHSPAVPFMADNIPAHQHSPPSLVVRDSLAVKTTNSHSPKLTKGLSPSRDFKNQDRGGSSPARDSHRPDSSRLVETSKIQHDKTIHRKTGQPFRDNSPSSRSRVSKVESPTSGNVKMSKDESYSRGSYFKDSSSGGHFSNEDTLSGDAEAMSDDENDGKLVIDSDIRKSVDEDAEVSRGEVMTDSQGGVWRKRVKGREQEEAMETD
jgi:hypothetical protein